MGGKMVRIASAAVMAAILFSSTPVAAATSSVSAPQTAGLQNGWTALSMLTPAGSIGLAGAGAQAGPESANSPPPPAPPPVYGEVPSPPVPVIAIWLATVATAIYILTRSHHNRFFLPVPNSPA